MADDLMLPSLEEPHLATAAIKRMTLSLLLLTGVGATAGVYGFMRGHHQAYGSYREIPWGILTSSSAFLMTAATGLCLLATVGQVFRSRPLASLSNRAFFLAMLTIMAGFMLTCFELESPGRMIIYNMTSQNLTSNLWWMTTLYGIAIGCLFLAFFSVATGQTGLALKLGIVGSINAVGGTANLGAAFSSASQPAIWYGLQLTVYFWISSVLTGAAAIIVFTVIAHRIRQEPVKGPVFLAVQSAGRIMRMTVFILLVVTVWRFVTLLGGESVVDQRAGMALLQGPLAVRFWGGEIFAGLVLPFFILALNGLESLRTMTVAAGMVLLGGFMQRYDLLLAGQIVPKFSGWDNSQVYLHYSPSVTELLLVLGALSLIGAGFLLGERFMGRAFRYPSVLRFRS